jgi:GNAT superfamily N-acetyltransferase
MNKYDVVRYTADHKQQAIDLLRYFSPELPLLQTAYFEWKYERNPYLDPLLYLAFHKGRVVGMRGLWGTKWEVQGQTFVIPCATNLVIVPEHRKRGIVKRLMDVAVRELAEQGYPLVMNLSATTITHIASLSLGWRGVGPLVDMRRGTVRDHVRLPAAWSHTRRRLVRLARQSGDHARRRLLGSRPPFYRFDRAVLKRPIPNLVVESRPRVDAMAALVRRLGQSDRFRHVRDAEYLEWRYQNPLSEYRFVYWQRNGGDIDGYLVLGTKRREHAPEVELYIVDWEAPSFDVRSQLLEAALSWGGFEALAVWAGPFGAEAKRLLLRQGFHETETTISITKPKRTVLVRPTGEVARNGDWHLGGLPLRDIGSWDVRMIYSDGF